MTDLILSSPEVALHRRAETLRSPLSDISGVLRRFRAVPRLLRLRHYARLADRALLASAATAPSKEAETWIARSLRHRL